MKKIYDLLPASWANAGLGSLLQFFLVVVGFFSISQNAYPEEGLNLVGILGPGFELTDPSQSKLFIWGASFAYLFPNHIEPGIEFEMTGTVPTFGLDVNYYLTEPFFVGIQWGADFDHEITGYYGPQIGYDFRVSKKMTVGTEIQYLITSNDRGGIFEALASFKYFF